MKIVHSLAQFGAVAGKASVVTWGVFDGMHRGHAAIAALVRERAGAIGGVSVVIPFVGHPAEVLHGKIVPRLTTDAQRLRILAGWGLDAAIPVAFDARFASLSPADFVDEILCRSLAARAVVVGPDTRFGKDRAGDEAFLRREGQKRGFAVYAASPVWVAGQVVSSTRVRRDVAAGDVVAAAESLGRLYSVEGVVVQGDGRGARLGFATANLDTADQLLPAPGVYAARALLAGGAVPAVANVGVRPTFPSAAAGRPLLEAHLLDVTLDLYGKTLELAFAARLRDEMRFDSPEALSRQIARDIAEARQRLG